MANGIPKTILEKIGVDLHRIPNHPLGILKNQIFLSLPFFHHRQDLPPLVSAEDNFDVLRVPADHPSRSKSDTFYTEDGNVLRTHMTAHLAELAREGHKNYLICGAVYRKDAIDRTHYPVFHQVDGFKIVENPEEDLRKNLKTLIENLLPGSNFRFLEDSVRDDIYFPFTVNSCEVEVEMPDGTWLELLGGGTVHPEIMAAVGLAGKTAWAFGLGLERIAMKLFGIPDIRLFWSDDPRFSSQFKRGMASRFVPFSKYPACYKDVAFWMPDGFQENELCSVFRDCGRDLVEEVKLLDRFQHPKTGRTSLCYRVLYRALEKTLTNIEVDDLHREIVNNLKEDLKLEVREK